MTAKQRIMTARLLNSISRNPSYAEEIGLSGKSRLTAGSGEKTGDGRKRDEERDVTTIGR